MKSDWFESDMVDEINDMVFVLAHVEPHLSSRIVTLLVGSR